MMKKVIEKNVTFDVAGTFKAAVAAEETEESEPGKDCELAMYLEDWVGLMKFKMAPMD